MTSLRDYLSKARVELTPEQRYEARMAMRGRTSDSAEDHPGGESGSRYEVYEENCPHCGGALHGIHRVRPNGSVDPRAASYDDDPNEAEEIADRKSAEAAYKSHRYPVGYEAETARIKESQATAEAQRPHRFKPAKWTHPNGHPRCRICGDEEPIGGECDGHTPTSKSQAACPCCGDKTCDCVPDCEHCDCNRPLKKSGVSADTRQHGVMVALVLLPEVARSLTIPGGDTPDQLHVTLGYFGKDHELTQAQKNKLVNISQHLANDIAWTDLNGRVSGLGYFQQPDSDQEVLYASVDVPGLTALYEWLRHHCRAVGLPISEEHGFVPHITLKYQPKGSPRPKRTTPLPALEFTPYSLICKIGEQTWAYAPGDVECPYCGFEDCRCIELADVTKSLRGYLRRV